MACLALLRSCCFALNVCFTNITQDDQQGFFSSISGLNYKGYTISKVPTTVFHLKVSYLKFWNLSVTDGNVKYWSIQYFGFLFELVYFLIGQEEKTWKSIWKIAKLLQPFCLPFGIKYSKPDVRWVDMTNKSIRKKSQQRN